MSSERNVAYVAARPIPPSEPPAPKAGAIHWLRRNLFNGVADSILTLISITVIVWLVPPLVNWALLHGVWNASSYDECGEIVAAAYGEGARGACWAVFNGRIGPLLFGFYPSELYWRPVLAFALLFVALAPVLFSSLPRRMLWFSAIYPIIAYALIFGGFGLEPVITARLGGLLLVIILGVTGTAAAFPIGIVLALGRQSSMFFFRVICTVIMEFFRGVPLIVLLFAASLLSIFFLPLETRFDPILRIAFVLALPSGVYMAEAIRGSLAALPSGQHDAAAVLGLNYWNATRLIILPQALKVSIPRVVITSTEIFKDITIVSMIGFLDPLGLLSPIRAARDWNGVLWELFAVVALFYWVICFSISRYAKYFENKLKTGH